MITERTALGVIERGGRWPAGLHHHVDLVVLRQGKDEGEGLLLHRALDRVRAIERKGVKICKAVLCCNDDMSSATVENRALIARALLAAVLGAGRGRLLLVADGASSSSVRLGLLALADTLASALTGSSASVSALFVEDPRVGPPKRRGRPTRTKAIPSEAITLQ